MILVPQNMDNKACNDCQGVAGECTFYRCNACRVDICWECIGYHYPIQKYLCLSCSTSIDMGKLCVKKLVCPSCLTAISTNSICHSCEVPHIITKRLECFKCEMIGCEEMIKLCGMIDCDRFICFNCGIKCIDDCDQVRCSIDHAEKCIECGCRGGTKCTNCQDQFTKEDGKRGAMCIYCINEISPDSIRNKYEEKSEIPKIENKFWEYNCFSDTEYEICDD